MWKKRGIKKILFETESEKKLKEKFYQSKISLRSKESKEEVEKKEENWMKKKKS